MRPGRIIALTLTALLLSTSTARGDVIHCVSNEGELVLALSTAATNNDSDIIKVVRGTYVAPAGGFVYSSQELRNLSIQGDYIDLLGSCVRLWPIDPSRTELVGNGVDPVLELRDQALHSIPLGFVIQGLTIREGGRGLYVHASTGAVDEVTIDRNIFTYNKSALQVYLKGAVWLINNHITLNGAAADGNGGGTLAVQGGSAYSAVVLTNNTVANNFHGDLGQVGGMTIEGDAPCTVSNNIFYLNETHDLRIWGDASCEGFYNDIGSLSANPEDYDGTGDKSVAPGFVYPFNHHLGPYSPLIDQGTNTPEWGLTSSDLDGNPRVNNATVDMGCYELPLVFADGFEGGNANRWDDVALLDRGAY